MSGKTSKRASAKATTNNARNITDNRDISDIDSDDSSADDLDVDIDVDVEEADSDADEVDSDEVDSEEDSDEIDSDVDEIDNTEETAAANSRIGEFDFVYSETMASEAPTQEIIIIKNEDRTTSHMLSKTEMTEAVSIRCAQIQKNPIVFVDIEGMDDPIAMAKKEINERKCPLVLRRFIGHYNNSDYYEYWDINEMTRPYIYVD